MLRRFFFTLMIPVVLFGISQIAVAENNAFDDIGNILKIKAMLADSCSLDDFTEDSTIPAPVVNELEHYTGDTVVHLTWAPVVYNHQCNLYVYFAVYSQDSSIMDNPILCNSLFSTDGFSFLPTASDFKILTEDTFYFRVYALIEDSVGGLYHSPASNSVYTIIDTTSPILDSIDVSSTSAGGSDWTGSRVINVLYYGHDTPGGGCARLGISETGAPGSFYRHDIDDCTGEIEHTITPEGGRKIIYAMLIDSAGNESNIVSDTIYFSGEAHSYPNPFNPLSPNPDEQFANLAFYLDRDALVSIDIFDLFGNRVYSKSYHCPAGRNDGRYDSRLRWDGLNNNKEQVASGGYICILKKDENKEIGKIKIAVLK
jgi:hypothetical protein